MTAIHRCGSSWPSRGLLARGRPGAPRRSRSTSSPGGRSQGTLVRNPSAIDLASARCSWRSTSTTRTASCCPGPTPSFTSGCRGRSASRHGTGQHAAVPGRGPAGRGGAGRQAQLGARSRSGATTAPCVEILSGLAVHRPGHRRARRIRSASGTRVRIATARAEPGHEAARLSVVARAGGAAARRLHGRPDYVEAVGADDGGLQGDGWLEGRAAERRPAARPWWDLFGDPVLHALEEQVGAANQDLKIAEARLREARAAVRFNRARLFPTISTSSARHVRESAQPAVPVAQAPEAGNSGDILLSLDMSYEVDLWGRVRRTVDAARPRPRRPRPISDRAAQPAGRGGDRLLRAAGRRCSQKQLLDETVKAFEAALRLTKNRFEGGAIPNPTSPRPRPSSIPRGSRQPTSPSSGRSSSTPSRS